MQVHSLLSSSHSEPQTAELSSSHSEPQTAELRRCHNTNLRFLLSPHFCLVRFNNEETYHTSHLIQVHANPAANASIPKFPSSTSVLPQFRLAGKFYQQRLPSPIISKRMLSVKQLAEPCLRPFCQLSGRQLLYIPRTCSQQRTSICCHWRH